MVEILKDNFHIDVCLRQYIQVNCIWTTYIEFHALLIVRKWFTLCDKSYWRVSDLLLFAKLYTLSDWLMDVLWSSDFKVSQTLWSFVLLLKLKIGELWGVKIKAKFSFYTVSIDVWLFLRLWLINDVIAVWVWLYRFIFFIRLWNLLTFRSFLLRNLRLFFWILWWNWLLKFRVLLPDDELLVFLSSCPHKFDHHEFLHRLLKGFLFLYLLTFRSDRIVSHQVDHCTHVIEVYVREIVVK